MIYINFRDALDKIIGNYEFIDHEININDLEINQEFKYKGEKYKVKWFEFDIVNNIKNLNCYKE